MHETITTLVGLFSRFNRIEIPTIQRDYAQGREDKVHVRNAFLSSLKIALSRPEDDAQVPLNLDFIYGRGEADENGSTFYPLDGQQRLTTLFLLHWYLACRDGRLADFRSVFLNDSQSRFAYSVRPVSEQFFDRIAAFAPHFSEIASAGVRGTIEEQAWFFLNWRRDPTIRSAMCMLDAIHQHFQESSGLYERLASTSKPAIVFHLLKLENFGLSDDLYLKMNSRGKPLTPFESFKARYTDLLANDVAFEGIEHEIGEQSFGTSDYVARRFDTAWSDLMWQKRAATGQFDDAFLNVFRVLAIASYNPESIGFEEELKYLTGPVSGPAFEVMSSPDRLDEIFTSRLVALLDAWTGPNPTFRLLTATPNEHSARQFHAACRPTSGLSSQELIELVAYVDFVNELADKAAPEQLDNWMRVFHNLTTNTEYNRRDDIIRSLKGSYDIVTHASDIIEHLASGSADVKGFSALQVKEECLKAQLIVEDSNWLPLILRAERHGYFQGQIGFLLEFSGVVREATAAAPATWSAGAHGRLQADFDRNLQIAEGLFTADGLVSGAEYRWQRALLCKGDYLLSNSLNHVFPCNAASDPRSWRRVLRGAPGDEERARLVVSEVFAALRPDADLLAQLDAIVESSHSLTGWRAQFVRHPSAIARCDRNAVRFSGSAVYLLRTTQMNGYHSELGSYCLHQDLLADPRSKTIAPFQIDPTYQEDRGDPSVAGFDIKIGFDAYPFRIYRPANSRLFRIQRLDHPEYFEHPFSRALLEQCGWNRNTYHVFFDFNRAQVWDVITELRENWLRFQGIL